MHGRGASLFVFGGAWGRPQYPFMSPDPLFVVLSALYVVCGKTRRWGIRGGLDVIVDFKGLFPWWE